MNTWYQITNGNLIVSEAETVADCVRFLKYGPSGLAVTVEDRPNNSWAAMVYYQGWVNPVQELQVFTDEYTVDEILSYVAKQVCQKAGYQLSKVTRV